MRYLAFLLGIGLLISALLIWIKNPPLPDKPESLSIQEAIQRLNDPKKSYISLDARPDFQTKLYVTGVSKPFYTLKPNDQIFTLPLQDEGTDVANDPSFYLGSVVTVPRKAESHYLTLDTVKEKINGNEITYQRLLIPLEGTQLKIWALSKYYPHANETTKRNFLNQNEFTGHLTLLTDLNENRSYPKLDHEASTINEKMRESFGIAPDAEKYVILTDYDPNFDKNFYCPVIGSQQLLYLILDKKLELNWPQSAPITGILEPDRYLPKKFSQMLKFPEPERIGFIRLETAKQYNKHQADSAKATALFGALFTISSGIVILWKRRR